MPKPFLQQRQQLRIVARLRIEHTGRGEAGLIEARCEQIARAHDPQHFSLRPGGDPGDEQDRRGIVTPVRPARAYLVQRIEPHAAVGEATVKWSEPERQDGIVLPVAGDGVQARAKLGKGWNRL